MAVLYIGSALLATVADFELTPLATNTLAAQSSEAEVLILAAKTVFMLAKSIVLPAVPRLQALVFLACMAGQAAVILRWAPHLQGWVNHLRAGLFTSLAWVAVMLVALRWNTDWYERPPGSDARAYTAAALYGVLPAVLVGAAVSWLRIWYFTRRAVQRFKATPVDYVRLGHIYAFVGQWEVEVVARVCRTPGAVPQSQDQASIRLAERMIKVSTKP